VAAVRAAHAPLFAAIDAVAYPGVGGSPTVVMTAGNWAYRDLLGNFACHLRRVGRHRRFLVIAFDAPTAAYVRGVLGQVAVLSPAVPDGEPPAGALADYSGAAFAVIARRKLAAVRTALAGGVDVLFSDPDVVWCADAAAEAGAWMASRAASAAGAAGLPAAAAGGTAGAASPGVAFQSDYPGNFLCSGFYLARARRDVVALFDALAAWPGRGDDQAAVNALLCDPSAGGARVGEGTCRSAGGVAGVILPPDRFLNGATTWADGAGTDKRLWYYGRAVLAAQCPSMGGGGTPPAAAAGTAADRVVLHNNHIWPGALKGPRLVTQGFWFFDAAAAAAASAAAGVDPPRRAGGGHDGGAPPPPRLFPRRAAPAAGGFCAPDAAAATAESAAACGNYCHGRDGEWRRRR